MIQTLYAFIAIIMLALIALSMNISIHANDSKMILNEVSAQVANIAEEFFESMAHLAYDPATLSHQIVRQTQLLADAENFGAGSCEPNIGMSGCYVMNDLHGKTAVRTIHGLTYDVEIELEYVDDNDPTSTSDVPTFSKLATVTVTSRDVNIGPDPLRIELTRLYSYPRVTGSAIPDELTNGSGDDEEEGGEGGEGGEGEEDNELSEEG